MKNKSDKLAELVRELADYLEEAHQDELDNNHYGDTKKGCSYCKAISKARKAS